VDVGIVAHPAVPVGAADAVGFHPDDHAIIVRRRVWEILDLNRLTKRLVDSSFHFYSFQNRAYAVEANP
jgi:hypothetical protein